MSQPPTQKQNKEKLLNYLAYRKECYMDTFVDTSAVHAVLSDLAVFCRAGKSTFDPDPRVDALLQGRKEVWLRIAQHLGYTEDELYRVFCLGKQPHIEGED